MGDNFRSFPSSHILEIINEKEKEPWKRALRNAYLLKDSLHRNSFRILNRDSLRNPYTECLGIRCFPKAHFVWGNPCWKWKPYGKSSKIHILWESRNHLQKHLETCWDKTLFAWVPWLPPIPDKLIMITKVFLIGKHIFGMADID